MRYKRKLAAVNMENHEENPRNCIARRGTQIFRESKKTILLRCQKRLKEEWQRSCCRSLAQWRVAFKALFPNLTSFFWTHKFGLTPEQLWRHPWTQVVKTRNQIRIVPRMILVLKQRFHWVNPHKIVAQMMPTTEIYSEGLEMDRLWKFSHRFR